MRDGAHARRVSMDEHHDPELSWGALGRNHPAVKARCCGTFLPQKLLIYDYNPIPDGAIQTRIPQGHSGKHSASAVMVSRSTSGAAHLGLQVAP